MKQAILFLSLLVFVAPCFADNINIVERKTCEQIKSEIATLTANEPLSAEEQQELKQLNQQQRTYCSTKGGGRRAITRSVPVQTSSESGTTIVITSDVLSEYIATKKSNCEKLGAEIEKLVSDSTKAYLVNEMHRYYDVDCVEPVASDEQTVANVVSVASPVVEQTIIMSAKTDEEWAAEFDANLAAGLCGDGTKPNKFGCCPGETFRDMGNMVFACCPRTGGDCFPPITQ